MVLRSSVSWCVSKNILNVKGPPTILASYITYTLRSSDEVRVKVSPARDECPV